MPETIVYMLAASFVFMAILLALIFWQIRELHLTMNSRLDELIRTTDLLARAEGYKAGQDDHLKQLRDFKG